jgi:hypothetical protein
MQASQEKPGVRGFDALESITVGRKIRQYKSEVDPLECPECGGAMKIISFIERRQTNVILKALRSPNPCKIIRIRARSVAI